MKKLSFLILIILLFSQCNRSTNEITEYTYKYPESELKELDDASKKTVLAKLNAYNTDSLCIYETPTYERLANDPNIQTDIKNRMDILDLFEQKKNKMDSIRLIKTDSNITISELFFRHGNYAFIPSYIINDTSIQIKTIDVRIVDLTHYAEKKELIFSDVCIAHPAEMVTLLKIKKHDRNKPVYYNNRKLKD